MNKGVVFDFSNEVSEYSDFFFWLLNGQISKQVADRLAAELLNTHVECVLDKQLYYGYRAGLDIEAGVLAAIESLSEVDITKIEHDRISSFITDMNHFLYRIICDRFHDVAMQFALWHVKPVVTGIILIEYQGDYRIIEWHDTNGVANDDEPTQVYYEFEAGHIHQFLRDRLNQYRGRYAGRVFTNTINHLFKVVIEEFIFNPDRTYSTNPLNGETIISQYVDTENVIAENFTLLEHAEVNGIIVDLEQIIGSGLRKRIQMTAPLETVNSWSITDKNVHIEITRPLNAKIEVTNRLKNELQASIDNGDYLPHHLRDIAGKL